MIIYLKGEAGYIAWLWTFDPFSAFLNRRGMSLKKGTPDT